MKSQEITITEKAREVDAIALNSKRLWTDNHRQSRVINRAYVKSWAIDYAASNRCHQFTRVSEEFLNAVESYTKEFIRDRINRTPSKGVTLK